MRLLLCILLASTVGTCDQMRHQPRYDSAERSTLFPNGTSLQAPPDGTVPRDGLVAAAALDQRPPMTPALLARGRERYDIYCSPCHDVSGHGHGIVPARGFPTPPDFHQDRLRQVSSAYFVQVITQGHGVMYSYADRVAPADRWAIAAYIRALQLGDSAALAALAPDERARLSATP